MTVPSGWEVKSLDEAGILVTDGDRGKEYPKSADFQQNGYCIFLSAKNVTKRGFSFIENQFITEEKHCKLRKGTVKKGDIVLTTRGSVGQFAIFDSSVPFETMRINSGMVILDCSKADLAKDYFYALCRSYIINNQIEAVAFGSAQPQLTVKLIKGLTLPIPPLPEQRKIAKILSCWDKSIATIEKLIAASKQQKKALMQQLLTGKKRFAGFEDEWEYVLLGEIASKVMVGIASAATHAYSPSGIRMLRNLNIKEGWIDDSDILHINENYEQQHRNKRLKTGDILTVRTGYPGLSAVVAKRYNNAQCFTSLITRLNKNRAYSEYVCLYINSEYGKKFITSGEAGGAQKNVNASMLKKMPLSLPSLEEQQKIAAVLTAADKEIELLEQKLSHLKNEKKALMQQLLTGKRRVSSLSS